MLLSISNNLAANTASINFSSHYSELHKSINRLSTGLRIAGAADDAAGLAVRESMRASIAAKMQGIRNVSDAISMIQVADGALAVINEKIIRLKELAEQAATGTYSNVQRRIMDEEFQSMKDEINRIANSTSFNGNNLLNADKDVPIHFGPENQSGIDNYAVGLRDATVDGIGLVSTETSIIYSTIPLLSDKLVNGDPFLLLPSGIVSFARISAGTTNLYIEILTGNHNDTFQVFTPDGLHVIGTELGTDVWSLKGLSEADVNDQVITEDNAFNPGAVYDGSILNGLLGGGNLPFNNIAPYNEFTYNGMNIGYSGDGNVHHSNNYEYLTIDEVKEDLVLLVIGNGFFRIRAEWDEMPVPMKVEYHDLHIRTQEKAQEALGIIDKAIVNKDSLRANLGATQNRLENTARVQMITVENMQGAESRISDIDVAKESTNLMTHQIKANAAVAILSQANILPRQVLSLITG